MMEATAVKEIASDTLLADIEHHFRVLAGPGAGKTYWLVNHIGNVIRRSMRLLPSTRIGHGFQDAKDHPMLDVHNTPAAVRFHDLRIEQLRQWHPARFGPRACGLVPLRLPPTAKVAQQRRAVCLQAIGQTEGDTAWG